MRNGSFKITNSWLLLSGFRFGAADAVEPWWIREPQKETPYWLWQQAHWVQARWWWLEILHGSSVSPAPFSSAALKDTSPQNCHHLRKNNIFHYCEVSFCLEESNPSAVGQLLNCKHTLSLWFLCWDEGVSQCRVVWPQIQDLPPLASRVLGWQPHGASVIQSPGLIHARQVLSHWATAQVLSTAFFSWLCSFVFTALHPIPSLACRMDPSKQVYVIRHTRGYFLSTLKHNSSSGQQERSHTQFLLKTATCSYSNPLRWPWLSSSWEQTQGTSAELQRLSSIG